MNSELDHMKSDESLLRRELETAGARFRGPGQLDLEVAVETVSEKWIPVPGFSGYEVSDLGRLRSQWTTHRLMSDRWKVMSLCKINKGGYLGTRIKSTGGKYQTKMIHRLVLLAFVGECPKQLETHHRNAKVSDNRLSNLEYVKHSENVRHTWAMCPTRRVPGNRIAKLTPHDVKDIRVKICGRNRAALAREYGVSPSLIRAIESRRVWRAV